MYSRLACILKLEKLPRDVHPVGAIFFAQLFRKNLLLFRDSDQHLTAIHHVAFRIVIGPVVEMAFASLLAGRYLRYIRFVVRAALALALLRYP